MTYYRVLPHGYYENPMPYYGPYGDYGMPIPGWGMRPVAAGPARIGVGAALAPPASSSLARRARARSAALGDCGCGCKGSGTCGPKAGAGAVKPEFGPRPSPVLKAPWLPLQSQDGGTGPAADEPLPWWIPVAAAFVIGGGVAAAAHYGVFG